MIVSMMNKRNDFVDIFNKITQQTWYTNSRITKRMYYVTSTCLALSAVFRKNILVKQAEPDVFIYYSNQKKNFY